MNSLILTPFSSPAFPHAHLWQKVNRRCKATWGSENITPGADHVTVTDNPLEESKNRISNQTTTDINYLTNSYLTELDMQFISITGKLRKFCMSAERILLRQVVDVGEQL